MHVESPLNVSIEDWSQTLLLIEFLDWSEVLSELSSKSSTVLMMMVEASAATRIRAMKTIIAPMPMEPW